MRGRPVNVSPIRPGFQYLWGRAGKEGIWEGEGVAEGLACGPEQLAGALNREWLHILLPA